MASESSLRTEATSTARTVLTRLVGLPGDPANGQRLREGHDAELVRRRHSGDVAPATDRLAIAAAAVPGHRLLAGLKRRVRHRSDDDAFRRLDRHLHARGTCLRPADVGSAAGRANDDAGRSDAERAERRVDGEPPRRGRAQALVVECRRRSASSALRQAGAASVGGGGPSGGGGGGGSGGNATSYVPGSRAARLLPRDRPVRRGERRRHGRRPDDLVRRASASRRRRRRSARRRPRAAAARRRRSTGA